MNIEAIFNILEERIDTGLKNKSLMPWQKEYSKNKAEFLENTALLVLIT